MDHFVYLGEILLSMKTDNSSRTGMIITIVAMVIISLIGVTVYIFRRELLELCNAVLEWLVLELIRGLFGNWI